MAKLLRHRLTLLNLTQELVTQIWFHKHPGLPWQLTYLTVLRHEFGSIHPAPVEIHPFLKILHSILEIKLIGASVHLRTTQAATIVSEVP